MGSVSVFYPPQASSLRNTQFTCLWYFSWFITQGNLLQVYAATVHHFVIFCNKTIALTSLGSLLHLRSLERVISSTEH